MPRTPAALARRVRYPKKRACRQATDCPIVNATTENGGAGLAGGGAEGRAQAGAHGRGGDQAATTALRGAEIFRVRSDSYMSAQLEIVRLQLGIMRLQLRIMTLQLGIMRLQLGIMRLQLRIMRLQLRIMRLQLRISRHSAQFISSPVRNLNWPVQIPHCAVGYSELASVNFTQKKSLLRSSRSSRPPSG